MHCIQRASGIGSLLWRLWNHRDKRPLEYLYIFRIWWFGEERHIAPHCRLLLHHDWPATQDNRDVLMRIMSEESSSHIIWLWEKLRSCQFAFSRLEATSRSIFWGFLQACRSSIRLWVTSRIFLHYYHGFSFISWCGAWCNHFAIIF